MKVRFKLFYGFFIIFAGIDFFTMKQLILKISGWAKNNLNKYWITVIIFVFISFLMSENTLFDGISYRHQIRLLKSDIEHYNKQIEENRQKLNALRGDDESLEKLARERYGMTKTNEELFIIKE